MSWGDHETEDIRKKLARPVSVTPEQLNKQEIERDFRMLELLPQYDMKDARIIEHVFKMENKEAAMKMLKNYINSRVGSAILHYDTRYVRKKHENDFNL
jgi:hypothetical protein